MPASFYLLSWSPAFSPLLGSVKPSSKAGATLATATASSRPIPSPHAAVIKKRKANILSPQSLDSAGSVESSLKVGAISEEEEKEGSMASSKGLFQFGDNSTSMPYDLSFSRPEEKMGKETHTFMEKQEDPLPRSELEEFIAQTKTVTRENENERIISEKNEELVGQGDISIGVQDNEVLQIVQNIGKSSRTSDHEKIPPLMNSDANTCLENQPLKYLRAGSSKTCVKLSRQGLRSTCTTHFALGISPKP